ncbi:MAG: response regulator [Candidatus Riflebacteria bacterium]|nr:response regulator [Candidatus Riflebacteria bacterium]
MSDPMKSTRPDPAGRGKTTRPRVLLLDDDREFLEYIQCALEAFGYDVATADTAPAAVSMLLGGGFDLLLLDINLGDETSGRDVLEKLRCHPTTRALPVVMLTAESDLTSVSRCLRLGAREYVTKPIVVEQLALVVAKAVGATQGTPRPPAGAGAAPAATAPPRFGAGAPLIDSPEEVIAPRASPPGENRSSTLTVAGIPIAGGPSSGSPTPHPAAASPAQGPRANEAVESMFRDLTQFLAYQRELLDSLHGRLTQVMPFMPQDPSIMAILEKVGELQRTFLELVVLVHYPRTEERRR